MEGVLSECKFTAKFDLNPRFRSLPLHFWANMHEKLKDGSPYALSFAICLMWR
jgi:hypothetical protein